MYVIANKPRRGNSIRFSTFPAVHATKEIADTKAQRLANLYTEYEFFVFFAVGGFRAKDKEYAAVFD